MNASGRNQRRNSMSIKRVKLFRLKKILERSAVRDWLEICDLKTTLKSRSLGEMSSVKEIESALAKLTLDEKQAVRDWLDDLIEDQLEVNNDFKAKVQRPNRKSPTACILACASRRSASERCAPDLLTRLRR